MKAEVIRHCHVVLLMTWETLLNMSQITLFCQLAMWKIVNKKYIDILSESPAMSLIVNFIKLNDLLITHVKLVFKISAIQIIDNKTYLKTCTFKNPYNALKVWQRNERNAEDSTYFNMPIHKYDLTTR